MDTENHHLTASRVVIAIVGLWPLIQVRSGSWIVVW